MSVSKWLEGGVSSALFKAVGADMMALWGDKIFYKYEEIFTFVKTKDQKK
jgi:hypothetical protein